MRREIKVRLKTQLQHLIPNIAEKLTFILFLVRAPSNRDFLIGHKETGSWRSKLYKGTNLVYSNNLKGVFNLFNKEIEKHNQKVISEALENNTAVL